MKTGIPFEMPACMLYYESLTGKRPGWSPTR